MIRPACAADLPAVVALLDEIYPERLNSVEGENYRDAAVPQRARRRRWVAARNGQIVGWGVSGLEHLAAESDVAFLGVGVHPAHRGRGIGSALYEMAQEHVAAHGARKLLAATSEAPGRRFLEARGFEHTHTRRYSRVDPREVDLAELPSLEAAKAAQGFEVAPFTSFRNRPELIHAVDAATSLDVPFEVPLGDFPFDEWEREYWSHPDHALEGSFAVVLAGRPVAISMLHTQRATGRTLNEMTGTLREFRGQGLARLAKLASLRWAATDGITQVATENDETNAPMLAINERLGYRQFRSVFSYVKGSDRPASAASA